MILQVVALFDVKARAFAAPFVSTHLAIAARAFAEAANTPENQVCRHPEDFTLYHLGTFNDETGEFTLLPTRVNLGSAIDYKTGVPPYVQPKVA